MQLLHCAICARAGGRSREPEDIISEIKGLVADGVVEVMLLGQNVNSYGKTLENPVTFAKLLRQVNEIEGLKRIRFMTSHPKDLSDELIEAMAECDKVCTHLHLPLQSGSTEILKKMNRKYTKESLSFFWWSGFGKRIQNFRLRRILLLISGRDRRRF